MNITILTRGVCVALSVAIMPTLAVAFDVDTGPMPPPGGAVTSRGVGGSVELSLDDGTAESVFGVSSASSATQFLWFNQFSPPATLIYDEVRVLFPPGPNMVVGSAVEIVIYSDADGDPTNGAILERSMAATIQAVDGTTMSAFTLAPPLLVQAGRDLYVGVIPRFIETGVTSPTAPAALDTTTSEGRSWFGLWIGDPPVTPSLPPDQALLLVDAFTPGNWVIRIVGSPPVIEAGIPVLGGWATVLFVALLMLSGAWVLRQRLR